MEKGLKDKEIEFLKESNAIEGEYSDVALDDAINSWNFTKRHSHIINIDFIKGAHQELMLRLNFRIAGVIRVCPIYVGNRTSVRKCLSPKLIIDELEKILLEWQEFYESFKKTLHTKDLKSGMIRRKGYDKFVKEWHIKFELIHPFEDGNGRVGRIIMNTQRELLNLPLLVIHAGEEQLKYYKWFGELK